MGQINLNHKCSKKANKSINDYMKFYLSHISIKSVVTSNCKEFIADDEMFNFVSGQIVIKCVK